MRDIKINDIKFNSLKRDIDNKSNLFIIESFNIIIKKILE